jgi:Cu/Ag efflux protein CusF
LFIQSERSITLKTTAVVAALLLATGAIHSALAAEKHHAGHDPEHLAQADQNATHVGQGKVVSIDPTAGTVKLAHEPIKSLKWGKMTMDFKAHDPSMLKDLKPGTKVDFELMKMEGTYHLMKISPSKN